MSFILLILSLISCQVIAAPIPGTATSLLTNPEKGFFFSNRGFSLGTANSQWLLNSTDTEKQVRYSHPASVSATLLVKTDQLNAPISLEIYARRWMKDYPSYGFDVLGAKTFNEHDTRGMVVDLLNKNKDKQLRQAIFVKESQAVIITCSDEIKSFVVTLPECNQMIRNFSWIQSEVPTNN